MWTRSACVCAGPRGWRCLQDVPLLQAEDPTPPGYMQLASPTDVARRPLEGRAAFALAPALGGLQLAELTPAPPFPLAHSPLRPVQSPFHWDSVSSTGCLQICGGLLSTCPGRC